MCISSLRVYHPFPPLKKNLVGQKFKDEHDAENNFDRMTDTRGQGLLHTGHGKTAATL
jgi:hypothetical protein